MFVVTNEIVKTFVGLCLQVSSLYTEKSIDMAKLDNNKFVPVCVEALASCSAQAQSLGIRYNYNVADKCAGMLLFEMLH
jgi:hypothetical protein